MTLMVPDRILPETTASEREVFNLIKFSRDSDRYVCLHSLGIARHYRKEYAETDFVLIGPPGIFCLEVKGGEVRRENGVWEIGWPGKSYRSVEGPFRQAQGSRWALAKFLSERLKYDIRKEHVVGWGVMFPDIIFELKDPEWDQEVVYDQRDKGKSIAEFAHRLGLYFRTRSKETGSVEPKPTYGWAHQVHHRLAPARL